MKLKFKVYECDDCHKRAGEFADDKEARAAGWVTVSYTHLTLPTIGG